MKKISIIISVYNEEEALEEFYRVSCPVFEALSWDYELIFVNDGSADGSLSILRRFAEENSKVKVINFSRNFGHEAAMLAGLDYSTGDGLYVWTQICSILRNVWSRLSPDLRRGMR